MKKSIALLLALVMCLSLAACGGGNDTPESPTETTAPEEIKLSKDEMLSVANPLTRDDLDKSISNIAFAKTLIGNNEGPIHLDGAFLCSAKPAPSFV